MHDQANASILYHACNIHISETAINIGYSCKLLTDDLEEIYVIDGDTKEGVKGQLLEKQADMMKKLSEVPPGYMPDVTIANGGEPPAKLTAATLPEDFGGFAIIINGHSLVRVLILSFFKDK